jgi:hypothetical protein
MKFSRSGYIKLLNEINKKYQFILARDWQKFLKEKNKIMLRHDIDFDTSYALEMAKIEYKKKIKSTYFFLMRDNYYDLYSNETFNNIKKIHNYGHEIGIHINPNSFDQFKIKTKNIISDIKNFISFYNINILSVSYHQPSIYNIKDIKFKIKFDSYDGRVMKKYKYFSDSTMNFKNKEFDDYVKTNENIQLLIHPVWWMTSKKNIKQKLQLIFKKKKLDLIKTFKKYDKIININNSYK